MLLPMQDFCHFNELVCAGGWCHRDLHYNNSYWGSFSLVAGVDLILFPLKSVLQFLLAVD